MTTNSKKNLSEKWHTFLDSYYKNSMLIMRVFVAFLLGLFLICTPVFGSSDLPHDNWQQDFHMLKQETLTQVSTDFMRAYKTQDIETIKDTCTPLCLRNIPTRTDKTEEIENALISVFGGKEILNETILTDIHNFSATVNTKQIMYYEFKDKSIRDNAGTVTVYVTERPDVALIQNIDISEIVSKATSTYADAHRQELVTLYREKNDETAVTKAVIEGIYKDILQGIQTEYQNLPIIENYYILTVQYDTDTNKFLVSNMKEWKNETKKETENTTETVIEPAKEEETTTVATEETTTTTPKK